MEQNLSSQGGTPLRADPNNNNPPRPITNSNTPTASPPLNAAPPTPAPAPEPPKTPPPQANPSQTSPAIRTMKSDLDRLFKTTPPSISQMITRPGSVNASAKKARQNTGVYVIIGVILILLIIVGSGVYYFWDTIFPPPKPIEFIKATPPAPFFATESSRTIEIPPTNRQQFIKLMADSMKEFERNGTMKHVLVKLIDATGERFISPSDFFNFYQITPPANLVQRLGAHVMVVVYTAASGTRMGLAMKTNDVNRTLRDMLDWESGMLNDIKPLFFGVQLAPISLTFEDRSYHNIDWRYLKLSSETDIGIGYGVFPAKNLLLITTSKEFTETIIDRLFNAR